MEHLWYTVISTARDGVDELDMIRIKKSVSQSEISKRADTPDTGQQYQRMYASGDVKLSKYLRFLRAVGCEMVIVDKGESNDAKQSG